MTSLFNVLVSRLIVCVATPEIIHILNTFINNEADYVYLRRVNRL